jgi:hypothetical protein
MKIIFIIYVCIYILHYILVYEYRDMSVHSIQNVCKIQKVTKIYKSINEI